MLILAAGGLVGLVIGVAVGGAVGHTLGTRATWALVTWRLRQNSTQS